MRKVTDEMDDSKLLKSRIADRIRQAEEGFWICTSKPWLERSAGDTRIFDSGFMGDMKTRNGAF